MTKLLFFISEDSYFCSHRLDLAKAAINSGYQVAIATRCNKHKTIIEQAKIKIFPLKHFKRSSTNPIREFLTLIELYKIYKNFNPDIVHQVAIKPIIYGTIIARLCNISKIINALGGLGYLFTNNYNKNIIKYFYKKITKLLFSWIFKLPNGHLILQNQDDIDTLIKFAHIPKHKITLIPGSGIDLDKYKVYPQPEDKLIKITLVARMLWDKGIGELVNATRILNKKKLNLNIEVHLYGDPDPENPASIPVAQLKNWHAEGIIHWHGAVANSKIAEIYAKSHIAVLPSYREGLPKSLLEAAACARPIVTTDVPGCRDVVVHESNGLLVPPGYALALAEAIEELVLSPAKRLQMGDIGRKWVEKYFINNTVNNNILCLYNSIFHNR